MMLFAYFAIDEVFTQLKLFIMFIKLNTNIHYTYDTTFATYLSV